MIHRRDSLMSGRMTMNKAGRLRRIGQFLSFLSIGFVVYAVAKMGLDFSFVGNVSVFVLVVAVGIGLKLFSMWVSATGWSQWLGFFARKRVDMPAARRVFLRANIGKYFPGNVMHYVQRNLFASGMGIGQLQLAMSSVLESASYVTVALLMAMMTAWDGLKSAVEKRFESGLPVWAIIVVIGGAAAVVLAVFLFRKKIRAALAGYSARAFAQTLLNVMALQLAALLLLAAVMLLLVWCAQGTMSGHTAALTVSAYVTAWVLGYVVPGASGGIGIREAALLLLLGPLLGNSLTLSLAMVHRLITIIGDFLGYLIVVLQERKGKEVEEHA